MMMGRIVAVLRVWTIAAHHKDKHLRKALGIEVSDFLQHAKPTDSGEVDINERIREGSKTFIELDASLTALRFVKLKSLKTLPPNQLSELFTGNIRIVDNKNLMFFDPLRFLLLT